MAKMHQTTLRFTPELWAALELAAESSGVSVAQYVREAALARVAFGSDGKTQTWIGAAADSFKGQTDAGHRPQATTEDGVESATALWAQSQLARRRSQELRETARRVRRPRSPDPLR